MLDQPCVVILVGMCTWCSCAFAAYLGSEEVPLGSIMAWSPRVESTHAQLSIDMTAVVPAGWHLCDGSQITDKQSPYYKMHSPDLTDRFLRGGNFANVLTQQEDQMQDHEHEDKGHTHTDHGHTHTDQGHTHEDAGHSHSYVDRHLETRGKMCSGWYWAQEEHTEYQTSQGHAQIQPAQANITQSHAQLTTDFSQVGSVRTSTNSNVRVGSETRPKSTYIIWIIKVAHVSAPPVSESDVGFIVAVLSIVLNLVIIVLAGISQACKVKCLRNGEKCEMRPLLGNTPSIFSD